MTAIPVSQETYMSLRFLAQGFGLLDDKGEPDVGQLLDALAHGKLHIWLPDKPIGRTGVVWFNKPKD